jgi:hypothetical protein
MAGDMDIRAKLERAWKIKLPPAQSLSSTLMLKGGIRWLYILGEGPAQTDADSSQVRAALQSLNFLVMQEIFPTETTNYPLSSCLPPDSPSATGLSPTAKGVSRANQGDTASLRPGELASHLFGLVILMRSTRNGG